MGLEFRAMTPEDSKAVNCIQKMRTKSDSARSGRSLQASYGGVQRAVGCAWKTEKPLAICSLAPVD